MATAAPYSFGNCALDPDDPDRCFASVKLPGVEYQTIELRRVSRGNWQILRQITNTSPELRHRYPRVVKTPQGKFLTRLDGRDATGATTRLLPLPG